MRYLVFNWKMNSSSIEQGKSILDFFKKDAVFKQRIKVVVAPPLVFLSSLAEYQKKQRIKNINLAGQNIFWLNRGSYTGETSPTMLKSLDVPYVLIGHSERRIFFNESEEMINRKIKAALATGLTVILCVGERKEVKDHKLAYFKKEIFDQLNFAFRGIDKNNFSKILIAYEPIWATGTDRQPAGADVEAIASLIKQWLEIRFSKENGAKIPILYGGSIDGGNIDSYFYLKHINGVLIGGASTKKEELRKIFSHLIKKEKK